MRSQLQVIGDSREVTWQDSRPVMPSGVLRGNPKVARMAQVEFFFAIAAVFFAPMNFLRYPTVFITLGDVFTALCLLTILVSRCVPLRPLGVITPVWMTGAILMIGGLLVSSLIVGDALRGCVVSMQYFYCLFILPLVIAWRPLPQVVTLTKVFVFSIILMCLFGIYLINIDGETNTRFVSGSGRMKSFVERANECGSLIALTIPLAFWLRGTGRMSRIYFWFALVVLSYGILLTGSNTGMFALLSAFIMQLIGNFSWKQAATGAGAVTAIVFAFANWGGAFLPVTFQNRVLGSFESGDIEQVGTFVDRLSLIKESLGIVNQNGLLGIGADQYRTLSYWRQPVHNFYLLIWAEGGFIAFAGYLLILLSGFLVGFAVMQYAKNRTAALCTISTFLIFMLVNTAVPHIYGRFWFTPLLLAIAVSVSALLASKSSWHGLRHATSEFGLPDANLEQSAKDRRLSEQDRRSG